jgi:hypothetical protein
MSEALLPCPFCGSKAKQDLSDFGSAMVYCSAESIGVNCAVNPETGFHNTQEQAIASWNTRADAVLRASHARMVEVVERMLSDDFLKDYHTRWRVFIQARAALAEAPRT